MGFGFQCRIMIISQEYNPLLLAVVKEEDMSENKPAFIPTNKRFLTATEVAKILDVSIGATYRIIKKLSDIKQFFVYVVS